MRESISYTPQQFKTDYTNYYRFHQSDSPYTTQSVVADFIKDKILSNDSETKQPLRVLNLGAGRQNVEAIVTQKLAAHSETPNRTGYQIVTADIANLNKTQLLAPDYQHVQANGAELPFANHSFDLVVSNMALDFMPRQAFSEAARVLKRTGSFLAHLHHPDLHKHGDAIYFLKDQLRKVEKQIRQANRFKTGATKLAALEKLETKQHTIKQEIVDAEFLAKHFLHHVFASLNELEEFLRRHFTDHALTTKELRNLESMNKAYQVIVHPKETPHADSSASEGKS